VNLASLMTSALSIEQNRIVGRAFHTMSAPAL